MAWPTGSFAKHAGRVGKLTMRPDGDGDTKLEWADGSGTSGFVKARELARATESEFQKVRPRRKGRRTRVTRPPCFPTAATHRLGSVRSSAVLSCTGWKGHPAGTNCGQMAGSWYPGKETWAERGRDLCVNKPWL